MEPGPWSQARGREPGLPWGAIEGYIGRESWPSSLGLLTARQLARPVRELQEQRCLWRGTSLESGWPTCRQHPSPRAHPAGLSMEGRPWPGAYQQPQVWHLVSQVHVGSPTRRHNDRGGRRPIQGPGARRPKPSRASVGLQGRGRGEPQVRLIRGIKACQCLTEMFSSALFCLFPVLCTSDPSPGPRVILMV